MEIPRSFLPENWVPHFPSSLSLVLTGWSLQGQLGGPSLEILLQKPASYPLSLSD